MVIFIQQTQRQYPFCLITICCVCDAFFCPGTDISAMLQPIIIVKFRTMIHVPHVASPLLGADGRCFKGIPKYKNFGPLKSEYFENGKLQRYVSIRA